ncbi:MAG: hypothetical protein QOE38_224, partial [Thermoleophilaceae bacterium]|nr:hypothetical protein [Thermoleophilaceae bacterium]
GSGSHRVRLVIGHVFKHARATGGRRLRVALAARGGKVRAVRITVRSRGGARLGRSRKPITVSRRRAIVVRLAHSLRPGHYVVVARGRSAGGHAVTATRRFSLR